MEDSIDLEATTEGHGRNKRGMICRVVCWLHAGEMLGESRLMMDAESIRPGAVPTRTATVVAEGHMVLLSMTTAEARMCFDADHLASMRHLAAARQDFLAAHSAVTFSPPFVS